MSRTVLTIGHSNHELGHLLQLLHTNQVTAVADIRSEPYSGFNPQFNQEGLKSSLETSGINYVFLGDELGARPKDAACYKGNKVQYKLMAETPLFKEGLKRVVSGSERHRIALLCAEKDPLLCHRSVLISRELEALGLDVSHILEDGSVESQDEAMDRLLKQSGLGGGDLFRTKEQLIEDACSRQEQEVAYVNTAKDDTQSMN
jgi:uncharacterized protein (DUF488 family)